MTPPKGKPSIIPVRVIPRARRNEIKKAGEIFKVHLAAPPTEGKANKMLLELFSEHFHLKKSRLRIIKGEKSRNKLIEIIF